jgi:acylphosphatase
MLQKEPFTEEGQSRLHAIVVGRVQGVSFRYFVVELAESLNLSGWVRNMWNGSVEVTAEGSYPNLETLLQALREGPPMASVDDVCFEWQPYTGEFKDFQVRNTV